jgi:hypothetical protein
MNGAAPQILNCNFTNNEIEVSNAVDIAQHQGVGVCIYLEGIPSQTVFPLIEDCSFEDNFGGNINGGAGVALYGPAIFNSCDFISNQCMEYNGSKSAGGAALIYNVSAPGCIEFNDCYFEDNFGQHYASDIEFVRGDNLDTFVINECTFNVITNTSQNNYDVSCLNLIDHDQYGHNIAINNFAITMTNNLFTNYTTGIVDFFDHNAMVSMTFTNNVIDGCEEFAFYDHYNGNAADPSYFTFNNNTLMNIDGNGLMFYQASDYIINNNIFSNISGHGIDWNDGTQFTTESLSVNYCLFYENTLGNWDFAGNQDHVFSSSHIIEGNPYLDNNYIPIWTTTTHSPCIDMGNPNLDGDANLWVEGFINFDEDDCDPDMTRMDIGAKYFQDSYHDNNRMKLSAGTSWICVPALGMDRTIWDDFHQYAENHLFDSPPNNKVESIEWRYMNDIDAVVWDETSGLWPNANELVKSHYGYKVTLNQTCSVAFFEYGGQRIGSTMNPDAGLDLPELPLNGIPDEYWLGYYIQGSMSPFEALDDVIDDIVMIKAKDWCMSRIPIATSEAKTIVGYTDNWEIGGDVANIAINYGEMVAVKYIGDEDVNFTWGPNDPTFVAPYYREMTTYFEYEEQEDYIPIYIEIFLDDYEDGEKPIEIAIFVNEECKGAAIIKDDQVQLNAYILNEYDPAFDDLDFRMYFPSKQKAKSFKDYSVMNYRTGEYERKFIDIKNGEDFFKVGINMGTNDEVPVYSTKLEGNFPNPFNPVTTIRFSLGKTGKVELDVYNIKGQKVKTLVNSTLDVGNHEFVWDGRDNNNKSLSSGVYFYKLKTGTLILTNKMLLLK